MIKKIQKNMNKKGFTLVELIIVIAVMAILAAIVLPRMGGITQSFRVKADERVGAQVAREVQVAIQTGVLALSTDTNDGSEQVVNYSTLSGGDAIPAPTSIASATSANWKIVYQDGATGSIYVYATSEAGDTASVANYSVATSTVRVPLVAHGGVID